MTYVAAWLLCILAWWHPPGSWDWERQALYCRSRYLYAMDRDGVGMEGRLIVFPMDSWHLTVAQAVTPAWPGFPRSPEGRIIVAWLGDDARPVFAPWTVSPTGTAAEIPDGRRITCDYGATVPLP